jgi:NADH dehydrogenase
MSATITAEHLRRLLDAAPDAQLVVVEGRAEVVGRGEAEGSLAVVSRQELLDRLGVAEHHPESLEDVARRLDSAVTSLGG